MGAMGSQRYRRYLTHYLRLDMKSIKPYLGNIGGSGTISWSNGSALGLEVKDGALELSYCQDGQNIQNTLYIQRTPCNYGGQRPWFRCGCGKRVTSLYQYRGYWICRKCTGAVYQSKSRNPVERGTITIQRLQKKLDPSGGYEIYQLPDKPPRMHWRTYDRIADQIEATTEKRDAACDLRIGKFLQRFKGLMPE